jgi:hypothetical protein
MMETDGGGVDVALSDSDDQLSGSEAAEEIATRLRSAAGTELQYNFLIF